MAQDETQSTRSRGAPQRVYSEKPIDDPPDSIDEPSEICSSPIHFHILCGTPRLCGLCVSLLGADEAALKLDEPT